MIEAYAFLATFTLQILAISVLLPYWFIKYIRLQAARHPADTQRFAQFYPGVDLNVARERFLARYRVAHVGIALLGALLLGWVVIYVRRPNWDESFLVALVCAYAIVQWLPLMLTAWLGARFKAKVLDHSSPEAKRKAFLQRRGLFDFVSPLAVTLAVSTYLLFAASALYAQQHASKFVGFKPFLGVALLGALTLTYALSAFVVYRMLYGRKINPIETRADHIHTISRSVKSSVYGCTACSVFFLAVFALVLLDLDRWQPFALSASLVTSALLSLMGMPKPPREPEADELGSNPAH